MQKHQNHVDRTAAAREWLDFRAALARHAEVFEMEPVHGYPDMVFTANGGFVYQGRVVVSRFKHPERQGESVHFAKMFERLGLTVMTLPDELIFEGAGDALYDVRRGFAWAGSGQRSTGDSHRYVEEATGCRLVTLKLVDPTFYHLDTCLCPLPTGELLYYPKAFDPESLALLESYTQPHERIEVDDYEAGILACNMVVTGRAVIVHGLSERLRARLEEAGYVVEITPLGEFHKAGGSARCLTLCLDTEIPAPG